MGAKTFLVITVLLFQSFLIKAQNTEEQVLMGLGTLVDKVIMLSQEQNSQLEVMNESLRTVKQTVKEQKSQLEVMNEQKSQLEIMNESLRSLKQTVEEQKSQLEVMNEQKSQLEVMNESLRSLKQTVEGQEETINSLQKCPCIDEIYNLQVLLTTDECDLATHNCSEMAVCTDTRGLYRCSCLPGYYGDGFECQDIDECIEEESPCGINEICENYNGTYTCHCKDGYERRQGQECQETACKSSSICTEDLGCVTIMGGYKAEEELGPPLPYQESQERCKRECDGRLLENITMEHMELLSRHFYPIIEHHYPWIGIKHLKWNSTGEPVASNLWHEGEPEGGDQECGTLDMTPSTFGIWDAVCSGTKRSLCQFLY